MGTLHTMVSDERKRRENEFYIELNNGKKEKKVKRKREKVKPVQQPRTRSTFDEKGWNEAYEQACKDLTPEQLEALKYISPAKSDPSSNTVMTPEEFAAL